MHGVRITFLLGLLIGVIFSAKSQTVPCPPNLDFEQGNLGYWKFYTGTCCPITANTLTTPIANRHTLTSGTGTDQYGGFPVKAPNGQYSLKLGNDSMGSQAERARYYIKVPTGLNNYSVIFRYAVVFQDPGHDTSDQPRFEVKAFDSATNVVVPCSQFTFVASSNLPGFALSTTGTNVWYKSWTTASIDLSGYGGKTVAIDFASGDCDLGAHFGYGYVDMDCGLFQISTVACVSSPTTSLSAPPGFAQYIWKDSSLSTTIDTGQSITIPTPTANKKYAVILVPYTGFGCPDTLYTTISLSNVIVNATKDTTICYGDTLQLMSNATSDTLPLTYSWTPSTGLSCTTCANPVTTTLTNTTYYVTVTNPRGCFRKDTVNVYVSNPAITLTKQNVLCYGGNNGAMTAIPSGGKPPYTYSWNTTPVKTTATASGLAAGVYTVTITDSIGCTEAATDTIKQPAQLNATATRTNVNCYGGNNGTATTVVSGGKPPYSYSWNTTPVQTTATATNLSAGTYIVTVADSNSCTDTAIVITSQPTQLNATATKNNVSCNGGNNGTAIVSASGGVTPYAYSWNTSPAQTIATATGLTTGTYIATVTDSNGCIDTAMATIGQPALLAATTTKTDVSCYSGNNGTATVTTSGGITPYSYSWNTSPVQTTATATNLTAGTYTVMVTDSNNCTDTATATIGQPALLVASATKTDVSCYGGSNGTATVTASGGTGTYSYSWNTSPVQTNATAINLPAGSYTVTVTDNRNCIATATVIVGQPAQLVAVTSKTDVACYGGNNGTATVSVSGGATSYTYSWNTTPVQTAITATNLAAGTYAVTVTDANNCTVTANAVIGQPAQLTVSTAKTDANCFGGNNGTATATPSGGTVPYTYTWNTTPVQIFATATNLSNGTYTVTVTDNNGCTTTANVIVGQPTQLAATATKTDVACFGGNNGAATVTPTGGTTPYTYSWNTTPVQTTAVAANLSAGTYTVIVTDLGNCVTTVTVTIAQPAQMTASVTKTDVPCHGGNNGVATATPGGGVPPYTYSWNTIPAQTAATVTGLAAGNYVVTVTDSHNCLVTTPVVISQPLSLIAAATKTDVSCYGGNNGAATAIVSGGTPSYSYSWNITPVQTTATVINLPAGTYTVTVTDTNNCTDTAVAVIMQPALLTATTTKTDASCNPGTNGTATANPSGGTSPYTYSWNTTPSQTSATATNLSAGTYTVTVTDALGCVVAATAVIGQPGQLAVTTTKTNVSCFNGNNGTAAATASGGTTPYTYSWNTIPAQTAPAAINLSSGTYTITVTDAHGCSTTGSAVINQPPQLSATITATDVKCFGETNGNAVASVSGGVSPYTYSWNTIPVQSTGTAINLPAGTYILTVTDANNCTATINAVINQPQPLHAITSKSDVRCFGNSDGTASVSVTGGNVPYTYLWNTVPPQTTYQASGLPAGVYSVTVTDAKGCTAVVVSDTIREPALLAVAAATINKTCIGMAGGSAGSSVTGGVPPYSYTWNTSPPQTTATANGLFAGTYTVTITDANGCSQSTNATVGNYPPVTITASADQTICQGASAQLNVTGAQTYTWSPVVGLSCSNCNSPVATPLMTTTYLVVGIDSNNCNDTDEVQVTVIERGEVSVGPDLDICIGDPAQLSANGGTEYTWSPETHLNNSHIPDPVSSTDTSLTYSVVIKQNECFTDTLYQSVRIYPRPTVELGPDKRGIPGTVIQLNADTTNTIGIRWEPETGLSCYDCYAPRLTMEKTVTYTATVTSGACEARDDITIRVACDEGLIFVPNTFTPNKDGVNDRFYPSADGIDIIDRFMVYNRWGELVHEVTNFAPNDPSAGWDGSYKGRELWPDVFVYYIHTRCGNGEKIFIKGDISLIR